MSGVKTWIVSREDQILSKLVWASDSGSELQRPRRFYEGELPEAALVAYAEWDGTEA